MPIKSSYYTLQIKYATRGGTLKKMKNIVVFAISLILAYMTWKIYQQVEWKFTTAFIGGAFDFFVLYCFWNRKSVA